MNIDKAIEDIVENFDYEKVHKVMKFLNWTWLDNPESPSVGKMVLETSKELKDSYNKCVENKSNYFCKSGGFCYNVFWDSEKQEVDSIELQFQVDSWEYNIFE